MSKPAGKCPVAHHGANTSSNDPSPAFMRISGLITFTALIGSAVAYWLLHESCLGIKAPVAGLPADRLAYALRLESFALFPIIFAIFGVGRARQTVPGGKNPLSNADLTLPKNILQNTVEQWILHFASVLIFSVVAPQAQLCWLPFLVFLFTVGRVVFQIGYNIGPQYRGPGFGWTFFPTVIVMFYNVLKVSNVL